jgi:hypothetical protein
MSSRNSWSVALVQERQSADVETAFGSFFSASLEVVQPAVDKAKDTTATTAA